MSMEAFVTDVQQFTKSSAYQFGDRTGFAINLSEGITLPGKCSPAGYLDSLGLDKLPEKVMVICAGNGGLAVECFARGAKQVVAVEPRSRFSHGVKGVARLLGTLWRLNKKHDCALVWHPHWPKVGRDQGLKDFDLILWPEGVEEITTPKSTFQAVADCLAPGGKLVVELAHGNHQWVEKINSWRPTGHAVNDMAEAIFDGKPTSTQAGRNATMRIYTLTLPGKKVDTKAEAKKAAEADAEAKKTAAAEAKAKKEAAAKKKEAAAKKTEKPAVRKPSTPPPAPKPDEPPVQGEAEAPEIELATPKIVLDDTAQPPVSEPEPEFAPEAEKAPKDEDTDLPI